MYHFQVQNDPFVLNKNFLVQTIITTFINLLFLFSVQNLKKVLQQIESYEDVPFLGPKWSTYLPPLKTNFFGTNHYYYFHLPIGPFHCAKFKKFLQQIQSYEDAPFLGPKWSICPKHFFGGKLLIRFSSIYYPLSLGKIFKKILPVDPEL